MNDAPESIPQAAPATPVAGDTLGFLDLLRQNRNYRFAWTGQLVSEIGDHFNNIAVFSLALATTRSGLVVSGVMLARAIPAVLAGPLAGVALDRLNRRTIMITSDLIRAVVAVLFILTVHQSKPWLLYVLSGLLMFASPFFSSGRAAILPTIANPRELHTANSLTQTTQWTTTTIGTLLGGFSAARFGYDAAFVLNAMSFLFSAWAISRIRLPEGPPRAALPPMTEANVMRPFRSTPKACATCEAGRSCSRLRCSASAGPQEAAPRRSCSVSSARSCSIAVPPASASSGRRRASA